MDFIEQLFGISPDGGNGALELLFLLTTSCAAAIFWLWRKRASKGPAAGRRISKWRQEPTPKAGAVRWKTRF